MPGRSRPARLIAAVAGALLIAYVLIWSQAGEHDIGRSDFTSFYVGATLLRQGNGPKLYDEAVQQPLHSRLIAPDREGNLPFVNGPVAAALVVPVTALDLEVAYRLWGILELALLAIAVVIAVRLAPWPEHLAAEWRLVAGMAAYASMGTWTVLMQAQWTPLVALGLALAYRDWKHGNDARGAALLVLSAGVAKPHLALGLVAFMLGWRRRRVLLGAATGAAALGLLSLALVGPQGMAGFFAIVTSSTTRWDLRGMLSFMGAAGALLGNGTAAYAAGAAASLLACVAAGWLGVLVRQDRRRLDAALAGAAVLSLLAAPHAYAHDLVMLAPAMAWSVAIAARSRRPTRDLGVVFGTWALINACAYVDFIDNAALPPGQLAAWALLLGAVLAAGAASRWGDAAPPLRRLRRPRYEVTPILQR